MALSFSTRTLFGFWLGLVVTPVFAGNEPLIHAHAHNDYEHPRPLLDALDHGFCGVEADIYLVNGRLLVAHNRSQVKPERTLQALYLDPLRERVQRNGGRVFAGGPEFTLLIDLKSDWQQIYPLLRGVLTNYADLLTTFRDGVKQTNAITIVISGSRAKAMFAGETTGYAGYDGLLTDLDSTAPATLIPWISADWKMHFTWSGVGPMPKGEQKKLGEIVAKAHAQGRRVRFWGAPDNETFWRAMRAADVDLINTDNLAGVEKFLRSESN
ncbi:MAG: phosphatidylinositol-specific phospholipase C/glycerophosphodiester phosphodiesterase family protein [Verrucomicrobiota bacterium]